MICSKTDICQTGHILNLVTLKFHTKGACVCVCVCVRVCVSLNSSGESLLVSALVSKLMNHMPAALWATGKNE